MINPLLETEKILEWKEKHWKIFYTRIADIDFIYRQISRKEYRLISESLQGQLDQEDQTCKVCTLSPSNYNFERGPAGVPSTLSGLIFESSGLTENSTEAVKETITRYREEMKTFDNQIACIITEAFPQFSIEEIENWPLEKSLWFMSRAEYVINELRASIREHGGIVYQSYEPEPLPEDPKEKIKKRVKQDISRKIPQETVKEVIEEPEEEIERPINKKEPANNPILEDPNFDVGLLYPEEAKKRKNIELKGSYSDFPELSEIEKFMKGEIEID